MIGFRPMTEDDAEVLYASNRLKNLVCAPQQFAGCVIWGYIMTESDMPAGGVLGVRGAERNFKDAESAYIHRLCLEDAFDVPVYQDALLRYTINYADLCGMYRLYLNADAVSGKIALAIGFVCVNQGENWLDDGLYNKLLYIDTRDFFAKQAQHKHG